MLQRALDAYERQQPAGLAFELVVVDDGSSDGTWELLQTWTSSRFVLRAARQANAGPAAARNRALTEVRAPIILFTGDDIEPAPDLLHRHLEAHQQWADPNLAVLGLTRWPADLPLTATMRHVDGPGAEQFSYHYMHDGAEYDFRHLYTSNVSVPAGLLALEPDGFCTGFPAAAFEDAELAYRLTRHGLSIRYHARAVAWHHHPYTAASFFRRQLACGAMADVLWTRWPRLRRWLSLDDLEWARLELLAAPRQRRDRARAVAACLDLWQDRVIALAEAFDRTPPATSDRLAGPLDGLLLALFRYAYLRGLATAHLEPAAADRVSAACFLDLLPPATATFTHALHHLGLAIPVGLASTLTALAAPGRRDDWPGPSGATTMARGE